MSERQDGTSGWVSVVAIAIIVLYAAMLATWIINAVEKRDNYIHDLQRRVGQLEQQVKQ